MSIGAILSLVFQANAWRNNRTVEVPANTEDGSSEKVELILGSVNEIKGNNAQYIVLSSRYRGGKFSSGYSGGEARNILFLVGGEQNSHWLLPKHDSIINRHAELRMQGEYSDDNIIVFLYEIISDDSNNDGQLSADDDITVSATHPDGLNYTVLQEGVSSVIDKRIVNEGKALLVMMQIGGVVYLKKYSTDGFDELSSKKVLNLD